MASKRTHARIAAQDVLDYGGAARDATEAFQAVMDGEIYADMESLREAAERRAKRYGIGVKPKGNRTPPKGFPESEAEYGDPVNYRYPADAAHAKPALGYFNHAGQREAGGYSSAEWAIVGRRLAEMIGQHLPASYIYKAGKLVQKKKSE